MSTMLCSFPILENKYNETNNEEEEDFCIFSITDLDGDSEAKNGEDRCASRNSLNVQNDESPSLSPLASRKIKPRMTLQQRRRSMLTGSSIMEFSKRFLRKDSGVDLLSSQLSPPVEENTASARWKRAFQKLRGLQDPWRKFHLHSYPAEKVLRHRYNALTKKWQADEAVVKMEVKEFNSGAMRSCYRLKKLRKISKEEKHLSFSELIQKLAEDQGLRWTSQARNCVAKKYMDEVERKVYLEDVQLQMDAKLWGEEYNRHHPPKQVDILEMSALEFIDRPGKPLYHLENFIDGNYTKYNSNSGFVEENLRMTPQAFSHFSFERSSHASIVVDIQGVGDLWTDPQMHTFDGLKYGEGNLGIRGMALFFHSHHCNDICSSLGLGRFDLYNSEINEFDGIGYDDIDWQVEGVFDLDNDDESGGGGNKCNGGLLERKMSCETAQTRIRGKVDVIDIGSPPWMPLPLPPSLHADEEEDEKDDEKDEDDDDDDDDEGIASPGASSRHRFLSGSEGSSANTLTEEEERRNFQMAVRRGARPSCVLIEMRKMLKNAFKGNSILGLVHHEMAKYHEIGRFQKKGEPINYKAAVFHEQQASNLGIYEASSTMAHICLNQSHDVLSSISLKQQRQQHQRGFDYLTRAAEQGDRGAMLMLAEAFNSGVGLCDDVQKNYKDSIHWFERSMEVAAEGVEGLDCSLDHPSFEIQAKMAEMYLEGGCGLLANNPRRAGDLFSEAAEGAMVAMKGKLANKLYARAEEAYALCEEEEEEEDD